MHTPVMQLASSEARSTAAAEISDPAPIQLANAGGTECENELVLGSTATGGDFG